MGTALLTALLIGLLTAFAFHLLLTFFGLAMGLTALGFRLPLGADSKSAENSGDQSNSAETSSVGSTTVVFGVGLGLLLSTNGILFSACFLAARFIQLNDPVLGAIAGVVIWSAYWLGLTWASSTAIGTVADVVLRAAMGGLRQLIAALTAVFRDQDSALTSQSISQEEIAAVVQQEIRRALDSAALDRLPELFSGDRPDGAEVDAFHEAPTPSLESVNLHLGQELAVYLRHTRLKQLTPDCIHQKIREVLGGALENSGYQADQLNLNRPQLKALLKERGLEKRQRQQILQAVVTAWQQLTVQANPALPEDGQRNAQQSPLEAFQPLTTYIAKAGDKLDDRLSDINVGLETRLQQHLPEGLSLSTAVTLAVLHQLNQIDWEALLDRLPLDSVTARPVEQVVSSVRSNVQDLIGQPQQWTEDYLLPQAQELKQLAVQQVEQFEQGLQARVDALKAQAQERLDKTRKTAAAAAWWLATTALTTAASAAIAGALASGMQLPVSLGS